MKKIILAILISFFLINGYCQESKPFVSLKDLTDSIQAIMAEDHIVGLTLGITNRDSVLFAGGFGYADLAAKRKVDEKTLFRLGSITKMFVSLGIIKLIKEGKLNLNDELKKVAPEVPFKNAWEATNPVKIVHLLEHTSGFDDMKLNRLYSADTIEMKGMEMMLAHKNSMYCRWKPGERYSYSNPNYTILGFIIEKLSGKSFDQYLAENIFQPLGMSGSNFNLRSKFPAIDVKEYAVKNGKPEQVFSVTSLSGAPGSLWSGAADMTKFVRLFLNNGIPLFDSADIVEMETPHSSLAARNGQKNGYGLANDNNGSVFSKFPFHGHDGLTGTCFSALKYNRDLEVGFIISNNSNQPTYRIERLIISFLEENFVSDVVKEETPDIKFLEQYTGRYQFKSPRNLISAFSDELQAAPEIVCKEGRVWFKPLIGQPTELFQTGTNEFAFAGMNRPLIKFLKNDSGEKVMTIGGSYFEKTSGFIAITKRIFIIIAIALAISSIILFLVSLVGAFAGKLKWSTAFERLIPAIGLVGLGIAVALLLNVQTNSYLLYKFGTINSLTFTVFCGTAFFGIATAYILFKAVRNFRNTKSRAFAVYYLLIAFSFLLITSVLLPNGWIALRLWAQ